MDAVKVVNSAGSAEVLLVVPCSQVRVVKQRLAGARGIPLSFVSLYGPLRRSLNDAEICPVQVSMSIDLRGGHQTECRSYVIPIILSVLFVGCAIAGAVLAVRESNANLYYQTVWWVGIGLCIAAACLLIILIPVWIYMLCCD
jgi:hypothetical protein